MKGILPIEDGVDVISVGTSFPRFMEVAQKTESTVVVIADNDGNFEEKITKRFAEFSDCDFIKVCAETNPALNTLEPSIVEVNKDTLSDFCAVLQLDAYSGR